jgi:hypothetical protein
MFIKRPDRKAYILLTATCFAFSLFHASLAAPTQDKTNSKKSKSITYEKAPTFHRRKGRLSAEEVKAAGEESNKFYKLAVQKEKAGKLDEAKQFYYKSAVTRSDVWGNYDPAVANIAMKIGQIEIKQKHPNEARTYFKKALTALSKRFGSGDYELVPVLSELAKLEAGVNDHEAASSYYQHILLLQEKKFGEDNPKNVSTRIAYIEQLLADKDPVEAQKVANKGIEIENKSRGVASQDLTKFQQLLSSAQALRASSNSK